MAKLNSTTNVMDKDTLPKSGLVRVAPCESTVLPGGVAMFAGAKLTFYLKKNSLNQWMIPAKTPEELLEQFPSLAEAFTTTLPGTSTRVFHTENLKKFMISLPFKGRTFDMSNDVDRFIVGCLKHYPEIGEKRIPSNSVQRYFIYDEEKIAREENKARSHKREALGLLYGMDMATKRSMCAFFGKSTKNLSDEMIDATAGDLAEQRSEEFITAYKNGDKMHAVSEINRLIEYNVFRRNGHAVYNGEVRLGGNTNEAAEWLMKPDQVEFRAEMLQKLK